MDPGRAKQKCHMAITSQTSNQCDDLGTKSWLPTQHPWDIVPDGRYLPCMATDSLIQADVEDADHPSHDSYPWGSRSLSDSRRTCAPAKPKCIARKEEQSIRL
eukprot:5253300-Pyramimonas_sp.AAC.1